MANKTRAVVFGGGGAVGRAWQAGLAAGAASRGVILGAADLIIGTSAGSVTGAHLALGLPPPLPSATTTGYAGAQLPTGALTELMAAMVRAARSTRPEVGRQEIGRLALATRTMSEEQSIARVGALAGLEWPASFRATGVNVRTGESILWGPSAGVPLERAVAASCSLPGIWPPITIGGELYMDGGFRSMVNADLAAGHAAVIVVSCFPLTLPEGVDDPEQAAMNEILQGEIDLLRGGGAHVDVITPSEELLVLSEGGSRMLDVRLAPAAHEIGTRQGAAEAARLHSPWQAGGGPTTGLSG